MISETTLQQSINQKLRRSAELALPPLLMSDLAEFMSKAHSISPNAALHPFVLASIQPLLILASSQQGASLLHLLKFLMLQILKVYQPHDINLARIHPQ